MDHPSIPADVAPGRIVYIRNVEKSELPQETRERLGDAPLYAIHDAVGNRLALVADRDLAFAVARQHEMTPVSAH
ncbi:MAG: DUF1150 family protein [Rubrimonas sp.]